MPKMYPGDGGLPVLSTYVGGTAVACGTVSTAVTVPNKATSAVIMPEGGKAYWNINGSSAGTVSPGYAAADNLGIIPQIDNLTTLHVYGEAATVAHVSFFNDWK